jgi:hypothetical protein
VGGSFATIVLEDRQGEICLRIATGLYHRGKRGSEFRGTIRDLLEIERTPDLARGMGVLRVEGLINVGRIVATKMSKGFDQLHFQPTPESGFRLPLSYGGTSGGGIWRVYVRRQDDGTYLAVESRLARVAYWETDPPNRDIIGHGPGSIYGRLLTEIYKRWP